MPSRTRKAPLVRLHEITGSLCDYALPMNTLPGLPPELLLYISDFLAPIDLVCFAMCNRRILDLSQRQISRLSPSESKSKLSVLARLERDLPETFTCKFCQTLHRCDVFTEKISIHGKRFLGLSDIDRGPQCLHEWLLRRYSKPYRTHPTPGCFSTTYDNSFSYWDAAHSIPFLHLKLAMKRFYTEGRCGISTDILANKQVLTASEWVQDIILEPTPYLDWRGKSSLVDDQPGWQHFLFFFFCFWEHNYVKYPTTSKFKSLSEVAQNIKAGTAIDLSCDVCNTDLHIELRCNDIGTALILTKWVYLGACLTDEDPLWKVHAEYADSRLSAKAHSHRITNPRSNFEETTPTSCEQLTLQNLSYLQNERYKDTMFCDDQSYELELWELEA
ncbi:hypothetical protein N7528_001211 [Penicillium herquei]|nr:hypothetical protein N7528_001211 [Penicillium herquei]